MGRADAGPIRRRRPGPSGDRCLALLSARRERRAGAAGPLVPGRRFAQAGATPDAARLRDAERAGRRHGGQEKPGGGVFRQPGDELAARRHRAPDEAAGSRGARRLEPGRAGCPARAGSVPRGGDRQPLLPEHDGGVPRQPRLSRGVGQLLRRRVAGAAATRARNDVRAEPAHAGMGARGAPRRADGRPTARRGARPRWRRPVGAAAGGAKRGDRRRGEPGRRQLQLSLGLGRDSVCRNAPAPRPDAEPRQTANARRAGSLLGFRQDALQRTVRSRPRRSRASPSRLEQHRARRVDRTQAAGPGAGHGRGALRGDAPDAAGVSRPVRRRQTRGVVGAPPGRRSRAGPGERPGSDHPGRLGRRGRRDALQPPGKRRALGGATAACGGPGGRDLHADRIRGDGAAPDARRPCGRGPRAPRVRHRAASGLEGGRRGRAQRQASGGPPAPRARQGASPRRGARRPARSSRARRPRAQRLRCPCGRCRARRVRGPGGAGAPRPACRRS